MEIKRELAGLDNLLFVTCKNLTEYSSIGRPHYFIKELSNHCQITIFNHPSHWKKAFKKPNKEYREYFQKNVSVIEGYPIDSHDAYLDEIVNLPRNISILRKIISQYDIDLIVNYGNFVLGAFSDLWSRQKPTVFDFADFFPEMVGLLDQSKLRLKTIASIAVKFLIAKALMNSDLTTCCSYGLYQYAKSLKAKNVKVISNGVPVHSSVPHGNKVRWKLGFEDSEVVIGFAGNLRENVRLELAIEALSVLKRDISLKMLVVGDGPRSGALKRIVAQKGLLEDVVFTGAVPKAEVLDYTDALDIGLLLFRRNLRNDVLRPSKLFDYLSCEKPVIATSILEIERMFPEERGPIVYANDLKTFVAKLKQLTNGTNRSHLKKQLKTISEIVKKDYSWEKLSKDFHKQVSLILNEVPMA